MELADNYNSLLYDKQIICNKKYYDHKLRYKLFSLVCFIVLFTQRLHLTTNKTNRGRYRVFVL